VAFVTATEALPEGLTPGNGRQIGSSKSDRFPKVRENALAAPQGADN
jgi:hypothetical protein